MLICQALRGEAAPWAALDCGPTSAEFLQLCAHHGVQSLLYHAMQGRNEWLGWPLEIRHALEQSSKVGVAQEMLRTHYLRQLLQGFAEQGVCCLLTKGEALARTLYPVPGTRTRCDSDLFIRIEDIAAARQAAMDSGFVIVSPVYKTHQFVVRRVGMGEDVFEFDVHWRILNAPRYARALPFDEAYGRSIDLPGMEPARALNSIDALLLACMHRAGSEWHDPERLIWLYDIHLLVSAMTPGQLDAFAGDAVRLGVQAACLDGLASASGRLGTSVPKNVVDRLAAADAPLALAQRYAQSYLGLLVDDWKHLPDARARRALLAELFFPDAESLLRKYGKEHRLWLPLLYLRHGLRGLTQRLTLR